MDLTSLLSEIGLESKAWIDFINLLANTLMTALIGWVVYLLITQVVGRIIYKITSRTPFVWDELLFEPKLFKRLGLLLASIAVQITVSHLDWGSYIPKIIAAWTTIAAVMLLSTVLHNLNRVYERYAASKERPIKVIIQVIMLFFWCAAAMIIISIFTGQPVSQLLLGLTAFAAVLMLIFQDSILGLVAGVQLSANHMVRLGDWIVMPNRGVDGDVIDISLTTVKVQNFDKTITTIPTHKLVSESFTNWRGMEESKGRRIKRSVNIDVTSIHYLTTEQLEKLKQSALLKDYIEKKIYELDEFNKNRGELDERRLTNVGTFRGYLESWLAANPNINQDMTHMVRQLQPGATGLPLEIYCFSAKQGWVDYENVQSDVFDHVYSVMRLFGLRAFQYAGTIPDQAD